MLVGQAIRAVDYNRGARYTGVVGKGERAWMYDPNVYLYTPAQNAFVNNIGARPGELGAAEDATWTKRQILLTALVAVSAIGASAFLLSGAAASEARRPRAARTVARRYR